MRHAAALVALLQADAARMRLLIAVRDLALPDAWIGAGFIRNAVWDERHGIARPLIVGDVDVILFDPARATAADDAAAEARLRLAHPATEWSVRNQARMHARNGDAPYASAIDAMRFWPETATAVAARATADGDLEVAAPYGLDDLFDLMLRPTPPFIGQRAAIFWRRVAAKRWQEKWPGLRVAGEASAGMPASPP